MFENQNVLQSVLNQKPNNVKDLTDSAEGGYLHFYTAHLALWFIHSQLLIAEKSGY